MHLNGKKILITAGPTWVPIDKVRVISNIASGHSGILLAERAKRLGAKPTLLIGPVGDIKLSRSIKIKRFRYFDELHNLIKKELDSKKYDIIIHSAAVSDYRPKKISYDKIKSNIRDFSLELETTTKIVDKIKKYAPHIFLVIFKLDLGISKNRMIEKARATMQESKADLAVVNTFSKKFAYKALIIDRKQIFCEVNSKEALAGKLLELISSKIS